MSDQVEILFKCECTNAKCSCTHYPFLFVDEDRADQDFLCPRCGKVMTITDKGIYKLSKLNKTAHKDALDRLKAKGIDKELL